MASTLKDLWERRRNMMLIVVAADLIFAAYVTGFVGLAMEHPFGKLECGFFPCVWHGLSACTVATVIAVVVIAMLETRLCLKYAVITTRRGALGGDPYEKSGTKSMGSAELADEGEISGHFDTTLPEDATGIIIGWDGRRNVYSQKTNDRILGTNSHIAIMGKTGIGKSDTFLVSAIYQCIKNGYSYFVTDPSGEMFETTSEIARAHGYRRVKMFNIRRSTEFALSDSFNPIHAINGDFLKADSIAYTLIANMGMETSIWQDFAESLLAALILYVDEVPGKGNMTEDEFLSQCNLGRVKELLECGWKYLVNLLGSLPSVHPAYAAAQDFVGAEPTQQEPAWKNASAALKLLNDPRAKEMLTFNDMDMADAANGGCAYYLVISATNRKYDAMSALFYDTAISELIEVAENLPNRRFEKPVKFILEELPSTGRITNLEGITSNCRKYNIDIIICMQYLGQLEERGYPPGIMDAFDTTLFLGTNLTENAKAISERMGNSTVVVRTVQETKRKIIPIPATEYGERVQEAKRELRDVGEVLTELNRGTEMRLKEIVFSFRCAPFIIETCHRKNHPFEKERRDIKIKDYRPAFREKMGNPARRRYVAGANEPRSPTKDAMPSGNRQGSDNRDVGRMPRKRGMDEGKTMNRI